MRHEVGRWTIASRINPLRMRVSEPEIFINFYSLRVHSLTGRLGTRLCTIVTFETRNPQCKHNVAHETTVTRMYVLC